MKILLIEDDRAIHATLRDILEIGGGHQILSAYDGKEGIELLVHRPDLILCDLAMPTTDGFEVIREIRSRETLADVPVIVISAKTNRGDTRLAMELGADDYLTKPFTASEVLGAVEARIKRNRPLLKRLEKYQDFYQNQVAANWTKELIGPLAGVLGGAQFLVTESQDLQSREIQQIAQIILEAAQNQFRISEKIIKFFHVEKYINTNNFAPGKTNIEEVVRLNLARLQSPNSRDADLKIELENCLIPVGRDWLLTLVGEILENAIQFTQPGIPIRIEGKKEDGFYRLKITDFGSGMSAEEIRQIQPFRQFRNKTEGHKGLGLGLMIARRICEHYGIRINLGRAKPEDPFSVTLEFPLNR